MLAISSSRPVALLGACLLLAACSDGVSTIAGPVADAAPVMSIGTLHESAVVNWHAQQLGFGRSGPVAGASAHLVRNANGISFRMTTNSLTPGNAYTLWLVVINNPAACSATPCAAPDFLLNAAPDAQVRFAAGSVAGGAGRGTFAGSVKEGPMPGWLDDRSLENSMGAEVHLVINDHGPMLPEFMPGMIHTYRGGCADSSPFPSVFPPSALADGEVGPNVCRLYQAAVFLAP
ncbi:MAG TPA: hypothetical protein VK922_01670 [Gemmatimonadaceae bacterium]|nr:hypothetical protein [Gemmatimonadaceae bacterium]